MVNRFRHAGISPRVFMIAAVTALLAPTAFGQDEPTPPADSRTEQSDESYEEQLRKRGTTRSTRAPCPPGLPCRGSGPLQPERPIDKLPEESAEHIRNQRIKIALKVGKYDPSDTPDKFPYEASEAAIQDPSLQALEQEAWEELVEGVIADAKAASGIQVAEAAGDKTGSGAGGPQGDGQGDASNGGGGGSGEAEDLETAGNGGPQPVITPPSERIVITQTRTVSIYGRSSGRGVFGGGGGAAPPESDDEGAAPNGDSDGGFLVFGDPNSEDSAPAGSNSDGSGGGLPLPTFPTGGGALPGGALPGGTLPPGSDIPQDTGPQAGGALPVPTPPGDLPQGEPGQQSASTTQPPPTSGQPGAAGEASESGENSGRIPIPLPLPSFGGPQPTDDPENDGNAGGNEDTAEATSTGEPPEPSDWWNQAGSDDAAEGAGETETADAAGSGPEAGEGNDTPQTDSASGAADQNGNNPPATQSAEAPVEGEQTARAETGEPPEAGAAPTTPDEQQQASTAGTPVDPSRQGDGPPAPPEPQSLLERLLSQIGNTDAQQDAPETAQADTQEDETETEAANAPPPPPPEDEGEVLYVDDLTLKDDEPADERPAPVRTAAAETAPQPVETTTAPGPASTSPPSDVQQVAAVRPQDVPERPSIAPQRASDALETASPTPIPAAVQGSAPPEPDATQTSNTPPPTSQNGRRQGLSDLIRRSQEIEDK